MAISPEFLDELRARIHAADVVGRRVKLTRRGRDLIGLCPFHKEKTPSFHVYDDHYHCFGCGAHGSAIDFLMNAEGMSFPEAVERLAGEAGMEVPQDTPEDKARSEARAGLMEVSEVACRVFERTLRMPEGKEGLAYFKRRGLSDETIAAFRLGFAPDSRGRLKAALAHEGINEEQMIEAGLLVQPDDPARSPYDRFRGRVMFPIEDRRGKVIAFGGRIIGEGEPKYLNSPETPLFHKGRVLYNLAKAGPAARKSGSLVLAEGYMDVIAFARAGVDSAVAPLGTALTPEQLAEAWRLCAEPILCFDGDKAGRKAAARAAELALPILKSGRGLRFVFLPDGEDPDSLLEKKGKTAVTEALSQSERLSEVLWRFETAAQPLRTPEDRAALRKRFDDLSRKINDPLLRSYFVQWVKDRIWNEGKRGRDRSRPAGGAKTGSVPGAKTSKNRLDVDALREGIMVMTLVNHPELFDSIAERLGMIDIGDPQLDKLRQEAINTLTDDSALDSAALQRHLCDLGLREELESLGDSKLLLHGAFAKPGSDTEDALEGWEHVYALHTGSALDADVAGARKTLENDMTESSFDRLRALQYQRRAALADSSDSESGQNNPNMHDT